MRLRLVAGAVLLLSVLFCGVSLAAQKAEGGEVRIGYINIQKIVLESRVGKESKAVFEKDVEAMRAKLGAKEKEVAATEADLKASVARAKPEERKAREDALASQIKELRRLRQDLESELKKKDTELTSKILKEVFEITRKIGAEKKYTMILQANPQIVYMDKATDITDEVIARYDSQYKKK
jgi:outer membrane protein